MSELPARAPATHAGVHRVDAVCVSCDRWAELDLAELVRRGQGDVPLIHLPLRCGRCGKTRHKIVVTGRSYTTPPGAARQSAG